MYPKSYTNAFSLLIRMPIMATPKQIRNMRRLIAQALRDCRKVFDRQRVIRERDHMRYVNGSPWMRDWF